MERPRWRPSTSAAASCTSGYGRIRASIRWSALNARRLTPEMLPYRPSLITADVAFISLRLVLPPAIACADPTWRAVVLVKPQFEAGRAQVQGGWCAIRPCAQRCCTTLADS